MLKNLALAVVLPAFYRSFLRMERNKKYALADQNRWRSTLLQKARYTSFGKTHHFQDIHDYTSFKASIPLRDYEALHPYIQKVRSGEKNILWPGRPLYMATTSGTTSGSKYIPLTRASLKAQIQAARHTLIAYTAQTKRYHYLNGKMIFLTGSPLLNTEEYIPSGRLSGIINHHIPSFFRRQQRPSYATNILPDWEEKLHAIVSETQHENMTLISGIPPWIAMYFEFLLKATGKKNILSLFPNLEMIIYGGVNVTPYQPILEDYLGGRIPFLETFPASEGFIAFEDSSGEEGLLLNTNGGLFFEFVPVDQLYTPNPTRYDLSQVKLGTQYALILNSNAGLWGYILGDTVRFVSLNPYRIVVTGRTQHFLSAFGEHVIVEEVERALSEASEKTGW